MAIILRSVKGSALTHLELDGNFADLDGRTTTMEGGAAAVGDIYVADGAGGGSYGGTSYGCIYTSHVDAVTVATIGTTAKKLAGFSHNGPANNVTADYANDQMTVLTKGDYWVDVTISFGTVASGDSGLYLFHVRVNDVESVIGFHRNMSGTSDKGAAGCGGILSLAVNDVVTLWVESDEVGDTDDIAIANVTLNAIIMRAT